MGILGIASMAKNWSVAMIDAIQAETGMGNTMREIFHEELHDLINALDGGKPTYQQILDLANEPKEQFSHRFFE
jgi:hypothetical protein